LTPEQFLEWRGKHPDWISQETAILSACVKDIADFIDFDIGESIKSRKNGDALWYMMSDEKSGGLLVLMCTPHAVFVESTIDDTSNDVDYAVIIKPLQYLEHLQNIGLRCLTPEELEQFSDGSF